MLILLIPYLLLAMLLLAAWLFVRRKRVAGAVLLAVVLVVNCFVHCFAVHPFWHRDGALKVMTWNIHGADDPGTARAVAELVGRLDPDVFCAVEAWHKSSSVLDSLLRNDSGFILAGVAGEILCYSKRQMGEVVPVENSGWRFRLWLDDTSSAELPHRPHLIFRQAAASLRRSCEGPRPQRP